MDPNQLFPDDYEGNSPSQNDNEKSFANRDFMGEFNANDGYFNNLIQEEEQIYVQNMSEDPRRQVDEDSQDDESIDEDQKYAHDNVGDTSRRHQVGVAYSQEGEMDDDENGLNDKDEDDEVEGEGEGDEIGESERYEFEIKEKEMEKESESNFGKSVNQGGDDDEDQRDDEEDDDEDDENLEEGAEGTKKIKTDNGEISVSRQGDDMDKKQNEDEESVQRERGENEGEETKQGEGKKDDEEKKEGTQTGEPERRKGGRIPNRLKMQVQKDITMQGMSEEERLQIAMESAKRFNNRVMNNRVKLRTFMKQIEKNRVVEHSQIDLNVPFPSSFVPVYMYDTTGNEYFSLNQGTQVERAPLGKFKRMNIENEGVFLVPEQFNLLKMEPGKRFQRRKKRRPPVIKQDDDD